MYCILGKEKLVFQTEEKVKIFTEDDRTEVVDIFSEFESSTIFIIAVEEESNVSPTSAGDKDTECALIMNGIVIY